MSPSLARWLTFCRLLLGLDGVVLLFYFGMPFHVPTNGATYISRYCPGAPILGVRLCRLGLLGRGHRFADGCAPAGARIASVQHDRPAVAGGEPTLATFRRMADPRAASSPLRNSSMPHQPCGPRNTARHSKPPLLKSSRRGQEGEWTVANDARMLPSTVQKICRPSGF
jgi:hypothetical protein